MTREELELIISRHDMGNGMHALDAVDEIWPKLEQWIGDAQASEFRVGYDAGYAVGHSNGHRAGYDEGYDHGCEQTNDLLDR